MYELGALIEKQQLLDQHIIQSKTLEKKDRTVEKLAAFATELGELMNEWPEAFKFWSHKKNEREKALIEYADGLSFLLSIAVEMNLTNIQLMNAEVLMYTKVDLLQQFLYIQAMPYRVIRETQHKKRYLEILVAAFIGLGVLNLKFEWDEILTAYDQKNAENHQRQEAGY